MPVMSVKTLSKKIAVAENLFGCSGDKLLEKQIDYIKELTLSNVDTSDISSIIENFAAEIPKVLNKRKEDIQKPKHRWGDAGWYRNVQKSSVAHIYQHDGKGMCYNCCDVYNTCEDVMKCKFIYILSHSEIPKFLSKHFIKLYLICPKCETNANIISPPKTWIEAMVTSIYNEANDKMITLTEQILKEQLISTLTNKSLTLIEQETSLVTRNTELENRIVKLDKILQNYDEIINVKNKLLFDMIKNKTERTKLLQLEETEIRTQIDTIEQRLLSHRKQLSEKMNLITDDVTQEIKVLEQHLKSSTLGKLSNSLKSFDDNTCQICFENSINIVLVPCGHLFMCDICSDTIGSTCPVCRSTITNRMKVFKP